MYSFLIASFVLTIGFSKAEFFKSLSGNDPVSIAKMIEKINKASDGSDKTAYLGAIKMKHAEHQKTPKEKLAIFREGRDLLEKTIVKFPEKAEYRFLRLMIQENAPKVLKYNTNIKEDVKIITAAYQSMPSDVKTAVASYAKVSSNLKL
jgi:hypothetical protein